MDIQQRLDVEVVGREDDLKQHLLINRDELLVPLRDVSGAFAGLVLGLLRVRSRKGFATVVLAVFEDLSWALIFLHTIQCYITFFRTLDETLGRGMGWSDSPTSTRQR